MADARVAVLISGSGTNMAALLYASRQPGSGFEVILVASNDPAAPGLALAAAEGVPTCAISHRGMDRAAHDAAMHAALVAAGAELVALAGYMRILTAQFVADWEGRMLNIHPSLLPAYPGLNTHQRALDAGDAVAGCTVHLVTADLDAGPVLGQSRVAIVPGDTAASLASRVLIAEHQLYARTLSAWASRAANPEWLLSEVRRRALALAQTSERTSHGAVGWRVGGETSGKFFAYFARADHGQARVALLVKASGADEQAALTEQDPMRYFLPRFYAPSGWIGIRLDPDEAGEPVDWAAIEAWLARSWRSLAPKRLSRLADIADQF